MRHALICLLFCIANAPIVAFAVEPPQLLACRAGDRCVSLHWSSLRAGSVSEYRVYRSNAIAKSFTPVATVPSAQPRWCDFDVENGTPCFYQVRALRSDTLEGPASSVVSATPRAFPSDAAFLEFLQQAHFDYFWFGANPENGLIPDRSAADSPCSIAATGFGLTAITIGIDHRWISRAEGMDRVRTTLRTLSSLPQGPEAAGTSSHHGWFYHFLDIKTGSRFTRFDTELSSIDTALLLAGILHVREYFDRRDPAEAEVRRLAGAIFGRVDWAWMANGSDVLSMGWKPGKGFMSSQWVGYNESMILYIMALGASNHALAPSSWANWTNGYRWTRQYGREFLQFPPLFGHQYSHCWIDFRSRADAYMRQRGITYFENSRRATLAQRAYCIANPSGHAGYSSNLWGLTACDGPKGYAARGAPPPENDDGTVAPTAPGGSVPFAPEVCLPALRHLYQAYRRDMWTPFGFRDALNPGAGWFGPDTLGIDQGPILIMIENYRTGRVWKRFMDVPEIKRGMQRAGFQDIRNLRGPVLNSRSR